MTRNKLARRLARAERGMTLIEIMVVVAILGMMATVVTITFIRYLEQAKADTTKIQMQNLVQALDAYKIQNGSYPSTEQGLTELVTKQVIKSVPKDGWKKDFEYIRESSSKYTLKSYGADGVSGGEALDKDIFAE
jgi:general secretion pathway protein G